MGEGLVLLCLSAGVCACIPAVFSVFVLSLEVHSGGLIQD